MHKKRSWLLVTCIGGRFGGEEIPLICTEVLIVWSQHGLPHSSHSANIFVQFIHQFMPGGSNVVYSWEDSNMEQNVCKHFFISVAQSN